MTKAATAIDVIKGILQPKKSSATGRQASSSRIEQARDVVVRDAEGQLVSLPEYAYRSVFSFRRYQKPNEQ